MRNGIVHYFAGSEEIKDSMLDGSVKTTHRPVYEPRTGHTSHTGCILYTWPYYTPIKGPSNCPKY